MMVSPATDRRGAKTKSRIETTQGGIVKAFLETNVSSGLQR